MEKAIEEAIKLLAVRSGTVGRDQIDSMHLSQAALNLTNALVALRINPAKT